MSFEKDAPDFEKRSVAAPTERERGSSASRKLARYRAPALERGLEVIELLAHARVPLGLAEIGRQISRRTSEIFRVVHLLEARGFIRRDGPAGAYQISDKLLALSTVRPPLRPLIEAALPVMRDLTLEILQACYLSIVTGPDSVVVARQERPGDAGFSLRLGHRTPLEKAAAGLILLAFHSHASRSARTELRDGTKTRIHKLLEGIRANGFFQQPSPSIGGIVDVSVPILRREHAIAALTVPYAIFETEQPHMTTVIERLGAAARQIAEIWIDDEY